MNLAFPHSKSRRGRLEKQSVHTLLTGDQQAVITDQYQIRKLTPRECWRLQGFPIGLLIEPLKSIQIVSCISRPETL